MSYDERRLLPASPRHKQAVWAFNILIACMMVPLAACDPSEVPPEPEPELCGNRQIDEFEHCDGTNLNGKTCTTLSEAFSGGTLACDPVSCTFDTRGCTVAVPSRCGDGVIEGNEECEPGVNDETVTCASLGIGPPERADNTPRCNSRTCRWSRGTCDTTLGCGNGRIDGHEQCDGDNLDGLACAHLMADRSVRVGGGPSGARDFLYGDGTYSGGLLQCDPNCNLSLFYCRGPNGEHCGNGIREGNEACDGEDIGFASCLDIGRLFGRVTCRSGCTSFDYTDCSGGCSNGRFGLSCN